MTREMLLKRQLNHLINTSGKKNIKKQFLDYNLQLGNYTPKVCFTDDRLVIYVNPEVSTSAFDLHHEFSHVELGHKNINKEILEDITNSDVKLMISCPQVTMKAVFFEKLINTFCDIHVYRNNKKNLLLPHCYFDDDLFLRFFNASKNQRFLPTDYFMFEMNACLSNEKFLKYAMSSTRQLYEKILKNYTLNNYQSIKNALFTMIKAIAHTLGVDLPIKKSRKLTDILSIFKDILYHSFKLTNQLVFELNKYEVNNDANDMRKRMIDVFIHTSERLNGQQHNYESGGMYDYCTDGIPIYVDTNMIEIEYNNFIDLDKHTSLVDNYLIHEQHGIKSIISDDGDDIAIDETTFMPVTIKNIQRTKVGLKRLYLFINCPYSFLNGNGLKPQDKLYKDTILMLLSLAKNNNIELTIAFNTNYYLTGKIKNSAGSIVNNAYLEKQSIIFVNKKSNYNYIARQLDIWMNEIVNRELIKYIHTDAPEPLFEECIDYLSQTAGHFVISFEKFQKYFDINHDAILVSVSPTPPPKYRLNEDTFAKRLSSMYNKTNVLNIWVSNQNDNYIENIIANVTQPNLNLLNSELGVIEMAILSRLNGG